MDKFVFSVALLLFIGCSSVRGVDEFNYRITNHFQPPSFDMTIRLPVTGEAFIGSMEEATRRSVKFKFTATYFAKWGWYIEAINGVFADVKAKTYWELFSNGVPTSVGVSQLFPVANDNVHFNFTSYEH